MNADIQNSLSYEPLLRAVGAILDERSPARFSLLETPGAFTLLLQRWNGEPPLDSVHLDHVGLLEQAEQLVRRRQPPLRHRRNTWALADGRYEDALRSLGFELDDSRAHSILLNELGNGLLVTYNYADPAHGYSWRKEMVRLGRAEVEQMVTAAHGRRQRRRLLRFSR